ncbi:hypothetical protein [Nostoc sp.]|uniref:hypothetical protein n=1 Tax=Nostoc sp. TaxID=1180 RepID=UPI002FF796D6
MDISQILATTVIALVIGTLGFVAPAQVNAQAILERIDCTIDQHICMMTTQS